MQLNESSPETASGTYMMANELAEAETLTQEIKRLIVNYESALVQEGMREQAEILESWLESYRRGLSAAYKISQSGMGLLSEMRNRLTLAQDELHRMDSEGGGVPASQAQVKQAEDFRQALSKIDHIISALGNAAFHNSAMARSPEMEVS